jgi:hypothetical protein
MWDLNNVALEQVFAPSTSVFLGAPLLRKMKKLIIFLFMSITGLHNKP